MVYNNFILSFQLDPSIFDPFTVSSETDTDSDRPEEEGDPYILAEDIPGYLLKPASHKSQEVVIHPEQTIPIDIAMEEDREAQKCQRCTYRQRSLDPYDSSGSYICAVDGSPITSGWQDIEECLDFEEATQSSEDDDSI